MNQVTINEDLANVSEQSLCRPIWVQMKIANSSEAGAEYPLAEAMIDRLDSREPVHVALRKPGRN